MEENARKSRAARVERDDIACVSGRPNYGRAGKRAEKGVCGLLVACGTAPPLTARCCAPPTFVTTVAGGGGALVGTSGAPPVPVAAGPLDVTMAGGSGAAGAGASAPGAAGAAGA
jgi:hypothetical protein